jgi:hypothetical protein
MRRLLRWEGLGWEILARPLVRRQLGRAFLSPQLFNAEGVMAK